MTLDPDKLKAEIQTAHASIDLRLTELRRQRDEISEEIKVLLVQQKALPVLRTTRTRKSKDEPIDVHVDPV